MSFIVTPPSASAASAASDARSTVSLSGCLPNLVILIPRIQTSSLIAAPYRCVVSTGGSNPNPMASVPLSSVPSEYVARRTFMPKVTCSGVGSTLIRLARTLVPSQSTIADTNGTVHARRGERDDRERADLAVGGDIGLAELGAAAVGAGVAAVEVAGAARRALVGDEMRADRRAPGSRRAEPAMPLHRRYLPAVVVDDLGGVPPRPGRRRSTRSIASTRDGRSPRRRPTTSARAHRGRRAARRRCGRCRSTARRAAGPRRAAAGSAPPSPCRSTRTAPASWRRSPRPWPALSDSEYREV